MDGPLGLNHVIQSRAQILAELKLRQGVLRDYVRGVAHGYAAGCYLHGRPGTAKTHLVRTTLERDCGLPYVYQRGHLTPLGLFDLLGEYPDDIIVLDDLGAVLRSDTAVQILLAALEQPAVGSRERVVKYRRRDREDQVVFRGGVIAISNRELHDDDLLNALRSRVHVLRYDPTDDQLAAQILVTAEFGWPIGAASPHVRPAEARAVAEFVITETLRRGRRLDLRLYFEKGLPLYQQWRDDETETGWQDLLTASIEQRLVEVRHTDERTGRAERLGRERVIAQEIAQQYPTREERERAWTERTGKSGRALYRRLAEAR